LTNSVLALLSGERSSIPQAEARALFLAYDPNTTFRMPEDRVLIADTKARPEDVAKRIAFARRVGLLLSSATDASELVRGSRIRFRSFSIAHGPLPQLDIATLLKGLDAEVDLKDPDFEISLIRGREEYFMLSAPRIMTQGWSVRRPRKRAFFHPSAIFPKLSRAIVNLTRCKEGEILLDPLAGTGSLLIEAAEVGLCPVAIDNSRLMVRGALSNMKGMDQTWLGVIRADAFATPLVRVDGIATDVPYGRASSTGGKTSRGVVDLAVERFPKLLKPGGRMVIMHPKQVTIEGGKEVEVEEEHDLYVHRKLIRAITILRRT
jgi:tRNA (guanine10-N2)-dimethyltransferase